MGETFSNMDKPMEGSAPFDGKGRIPAAFDDRYEEALAEMVKAKIEGRKVIPLRRPEPTKSNDLLEALRESAGVKGGAKAKKPARKTTRKASTAKSKTAAAPARNRR